LFFLVTDSNNLISEKIREKKLNHVD